MGLKVVGADVTDVKLGATQVAKVMVGAEQVWPVKSSYEPYEWILDTYNNEQIPGHIGLDVGGGRGAYLRVNRVDLTGVDRTSEYGNNTTDTWWDLGTLTVYNITEGTSFQLQDIRSIYSTSSNRIVLHDTAHDRPGQSQWPQIGKFGDVVRLVPFGTTP